MSFKTVAAFLLLVTHLVSSELSIESGSQNGTTIRSAEFYKKGDNFTSFFAPISGYMALDNSSDISGKIAVVPQLPMQAIYSQFFAVQSRGAIGIVYIADTLVPGQYFCTYTFEDVQQLVIPVAEISLSEFKIIEELLVQGEQIFVTLTSEGNAWTDVIVNSLATLIVYRIILGATSTALIGYALFKLSLFIKAQGSHFNVPQVCLGLEIIANLWRILWVVGDPFGCFYVYGSAVSSFLDTASLPYTTATFVLITFYWHEAVSDTSIKIYPFLARLKIPFFVITLTLIGVDLMISLLGFFIALDTSILAIIYIIISVAFVCFYFITVGKITQRLRKSPGQKDDGRFKRLSNVTNKMIMNGIGKCFLIIIGIAFSFKAVSAAPVPQYIGTTVILIVVNFESFARILLFDVRKKKSGSSQKTNTNSNSPNASSATTNMMNMSARSSTVAAV